jgi:gamma-glutamyl-gamma-aminobutyrate hydrolase PuuD
MILFSKRRDSSTEVHLNSICRGFNILHIIKGGGIIRKIMVLEESSKVMSN